MAIVLLSRVALWREAFGADGGTQKVMEYEDRIGVTPQGEPVMMLFFMCPGCGIYMGSKMWKGARREPHQRTALVLRRQLVRVQSPTPEDVCRPAGKAWGATEIGGGSRPSLLERISLHYTSDPKCRGWNTDLCLVVQ